MNEAYHERGCVLKLEQAMEVMKHDLVDRHPYTNPDVNEAIQLLIEAGKYRKHLKDEGIIMPGFLLPGETED